MIEVPFIDLAAHHAPLRAELDAAIGKVIDCGAFAGGPFVDRFEEQFAGYCGVRHCLGVGSGTEALWLCLLAAGIGPGDEVITVPGTFIATAEAITYCGATPVFVDIDEETYTLDPSRLPEAITPRTRAIIPVHLFGQTADMDPILRVARTHGLLVIEDAAQAHGAEYKGRPAGSLGDGGCFSFYPGKNLGAFGDAGAVVTNDADLQRKIRSLRDHGQTRKYHHDVVGWNARMDGLQAAVLGVKLPYLDAANERRRICAAAYDRALGEHPGILTPARAGFARHVYHIYAVRHPERDALKLRLAESGIGCGIHYPVPLHLQPAYRHLGYQAGDFPVAERCAREFLSLPMFPELTRQQQDRVISAVTQTPACSLAA